MDFSSSDLEEENMDTRTDQRRRSPSPPVTPPAISVLEEDLQHIENASNCGNFLAEMFQLIDNINNYSFDSEEDKSTYHSRLVEICNEGTALLESLRQLETDHLGDLIKRFHQKTGQSSTQKVETTNRFSNLQIEDPPIIEDEQEERDEDIPQPKPPRFRSPPPITIDNVNNSAAFLKQLQNMTQENLMGRIIGKGLRVYPKTPQAYHKIRNFIDHEKLESYTYQLNEEKELKVVIRGMPSDMPPQQIIEGLSELGLTINDCHVMINRKTGLPMPLFLLSLPKYEPNKDVYNITELCYMKIKIEPLDKKKGPAQCFRCQGFFHSSKFCTRNPKCVKCGKPHLTSDCKKPKDTEATCCHCQGNHPANFSGCPKNPLNKPPPPPKVNFLDERTRKRKEEMEARKQQPQTSISAPVPPASTKPKPQPTAPQPAITRPTPKPHPEPEAAPQPSSPTTSQEPSLTSTLKELQSPKVVKLLTTDKLHIVSWNADGIQHRIQELENYINDNSPDIIAFQETNLRPCIDLNIPNYSTHRNDRLTHRGGGTAILVKNSIAHHVINIYTTAVNITAIEIEGPTNNTTVCSLYRSPSSPINSFIPDLIKIFRNRAQCIVVGDYNARHSTWNPNRRGNTAGTRLFHYANTCGLVISAPTDFTRIPQQQNHQPSVIDLGVSCGINNIAVESRYDLSSDHNPVHFVVKFNFKTSHLLNCKTITNWNKFQDILSTTIAGNPPINNTEEIDEAISKLNYNIHTALNQSSKFKSMKQDFTLVPYATRMKIRGKNRLRKLWQQNRYPPLKTELNRLQRDIKKDLLNIKQREWDDALVECSHTNDSLHKLIARAKKKPVIYPPLLGFQGLVYGTREKADLFVDTLEDSFQENITPYDDDHIDKVDRTVRRFLRNNIPIYPPLTSPKKYVK
ncbi:nucleic-acid-binding protein from transposon X-element [Trichonephila clavipes]|nr:nucleic-acid-binding protein from transposon X-element [Trichonephila clavipes]